MGEKEQIRICQVLHGIVGGGSEQVVLNYCSRMKNVKVDLLYQYDPNPQILERFNDVGINCIRIPDKVHHPIAHLLTMYRIFKKGKYDVVHSHLDWFLNASAMLCAYFARVPKRFAHHHQVYNPKNPLLKLLCALLRVPNRMFATHWLACGNEAAVDGWGGNAVKQGRIIILPNAIDPERFKFDVAARAKIRQQYGIADDEFVVGHVGRFFPQKNHAFLIDVFAELVKTKPQSKLLLLGDGPLLDGIREKVCTLGLSDKVVFVGLQKDPAPFYSAMDAFCFPSLWEGLPLTLVEAQYNGLHVICSDMITGEVFISTFFERLKIKKREIWAEMLKNVSCRNQQNVLFCENKKFDIRETSKILETFYRC